jgi:hypothetical protein
MRHALRLPTVLVYTVLGAAAQGCSSAQPADASAPDTTAMVDSARPDTALEDTTPADVCPDPLKCYASIMPDNEGGAFVVYLRRDGGMSDVPCPPVPPQCPVV